MIKNKLGIKDEAKLANEEEKISKKKAKKLFEENLLCSKTPGSFATLSFIHEYLFEDIYDFAGKIREVNLAKDNFRFASLLYLEVALKNIEKMPQKSFDEIVQKYVEMNIAHPFREGNGRATRIWLDDILKNELKKVINWAKIDKNDYLLAMQRSPIKDTELKQLLKEALSDEIESKSLFMKGLDASYNYEGYKSFLYEEPLILAQDELATLCELLPNEGIVLLRGELAAGKTTLVKAKAAQMGIEAEVSSPSFALMHEYGGLYHYDLYNAGLEGLLKRGLFEKLFESGLHMIEWGDEDLQSLLEKYGQSVKIVSITQEGAKRSYNFE